MRLTLFVLVSVALLAVGCSAAVNAPPRELAAQRPHPAAAADATAILSPSACGAHEHRLVVQPEQASFWLSLPLTSANRWLSELPADLQAELDRSGAEQVAVMCVPHEQFEAVQQQLAEMHSMAASNVDSDAELSEAADVASSFESQQAGADAEEPEPTDPRYIKLKALQQRFNAVLANIKEKKASDADVTELGAIIAGLESEFASYPADMQAELRQSKEGLVAFITRVQTELKAKLAAAKKTAVVKTTDAAADGSASETDLQVAAVVDEQESETTVLALLSDAESSFHQALDAAQRSSDRERGSDRDRRRRRRRGGRRENRRRRREGRRGRDSRSKDDMSRKDMLTGAEAEPQWSAAEDSQADVVEQMLQQQQMMEQQQMSSYGAAAEADYAPADEQMLLGESELLLHLAEANQQLDSSIDAQLQLESDADAQQQLEPGFSSAQFPFRHPRGRMDDWRGRRDERRDERRDDRRDERRRDRRDRRDERRDERRDNRRDERNPFDERRRGDRFDERRADRFDDIGRNIGERIGSNIGLPFGNVFRTAQA